MPHSLGYESSFTIFYSVFTYTKTVPHDEIGYVWCIPVVPQIVERISIRLLALEENSSGTDYQSSYCSK